MANQDKGKPISYYVQNPWTAHPNWRTLSKEDWDKVNQARSKVPKPADFKCFGRTGHDRRSATIAAATLTPSPSPAPATTATTPALVAPTIATTSTVHDAPTVVASNLTTTAPGTMICEILSNRQSNVYQHSDGHMYLLINKTHMHRVSKTQGLPHGWWCQWWNDWQRGPSPLSN
jgi:hypothetical protein